MSKGLDTLVRLRKMELDGLRRELGELNREVEAIEGEKMRLSQQLVEEQMHLKRSEALQTFGLYAQAVQARQEDLDTARVEMEHKIEFKSRQVATAYEALKTAEIALEQKQREFRKKEARAEQELLDEMALSNFRRQNAPENSGGL